MKWKSGAYFLAGDFWFCIQEDGNARDGEMPEYTHFAFTVSKDSFSQVVDKIKAAGVQEWQLNQSEGESFYFTDPDGHKLEIHVGDWKSRLDSVKANPWDESVEFFDK